MYLTALHNNNNKMMKKRLIHKVWMVCLASLMISTASGAARRHIGTATMCSILRLLWRVFDGTVNVRVHITRLICMFSCACCSSYCWCQWDIKANESFRLNVKMKTKCEVSAVENTSVFHKHTFQVHFFICVSVWVCGCVANQKVKCIK